MVVHNKAHVHIYVLLGSISAPVSLLLRLVLYAYFVSTSTVNYLKSFPK